MDILELAGKHINKIFAEPFKKDTKCQLQILPHLLTSHNLISCSNKVVAFDSKKILNLAQLNRFQARRCMAILVE